MGSEAGEDTWSVSVKKALRISLVRATAAGEVKPINTFKPKFAYSIFGDDEQIFGYQGLTVNLAFNASDMRPNLQVKYQKKFPPAPDVEATDVEGALQDFLPEVAFQKKKDFDNAIQRVRKDWTPPGSLVASFTRGGTTREVWMGNLGDLAVKQLLKRIQIFVPLFIEGGTLIPTDDDTDAEDDRWTIFFLYSKAPAPDASDQFVYTFNGYSTVYRFFHIQTPTPPASPSNLEDLDFDSDFDLASLPCRTRISQFVILPPFQMNGLGLKLYSIIYQHYLNHPQTVEITVEDPNEAFDDMRDVADLIFLRQRDDFNALKLDTSLVLPKGSAKVPNNIIDQAAADEVRRKTKIAPRQFTRVLEMHLMSKLPEAVRPGISADKQVARRAPKEDRYQSTLWHILMKKRIFNQNKDALGEMDLDERVEKLSETVRSVAWQYESLIVRADNATRKEKEAQEAEKAKSAAESDDETGKSGSESGKRKAADEASGETNAKKQKLAERSRTGMSANVPI
ncbi:hypothetical protein OQA88_203 [Cercophora sp. LCS_1]